AAGEIQHRRVDDAARVEIGRATGKIQSVVRDRVITGERRSAGAHHVRAGDVERAVQIYRRATDFKVSRAGEARTRAQIVRARSEKVQRRVRANFKTSRRVATVQLHCAAQQLHLAAVVKQIGEGGFSTDLVNDAIRVDRAGPTQHER